MLFRTFMVLFTLNTNRNVRQIDSLSHRSLSLLLFSIQMKLTGTGGCHSAARLLLLFSTKEKKARYNIFNFLNGLQILRKIYYRIARPEFSA